MPLPPQFHRLRRRRDLARQYRYCASLSGSVQKVWWMVAEHHAESV